MIEVFCLLNTKPINIAPNPFFPLFTKRTDVFSLNPDKIRKLGKNLKDEIAGFKGYGW